MEMSKHEEGIDRQRRALVLGAVLIGVLVLAMLLFEVQRNSAIISATTRQRIHLTQDARP